MSFAEGIGSAVGVVDGADGGAAAGGIAGLALWPCAKNAVAASESSAVEVKSDRGG